MLSVAESYPQDRQCEMVDAVTRSIKALAFYGSIMRKSPLYTLIDDQLGMLLLLLALCAQRHNSTFNWQ